MANDRDLDALLNEALAGYVNAEPDPSLRVRVMARTAAASPRRTWRIAWPAATTCAALLLAFLLYPAHRSPRNRVIEDHAVQVPAAPSQPHADSAKLDRTSPDSAQPHVVPATRHRYYRKEPIIPHRSISLAPAPLTEEEMILLRFAQQHPDQAREVLSPPPSGPIQADPVIIAPIQIADLSGLRSDSH